MKRRWRLARLYWYTVEFGLIRDARGTNGLSIYGAGIVSSKGESLYSLESAAPDRLGFDLERVMRTKYRIDTFQKTYFVIDDFAQLFALADVDGRALAAAWRRCPSSRPARCSRPIACCIAARATAGPTTRTRDARGAGTSLCRHPDRLPRIPSPVARPRMPVPQL